MAKRTPRQIDQLTQMTRKASAKAAQRRDADGLTLLRQMAVAGLSFGDMARNLESEGVLTPRGNWWWSREQVRRTLKFALGTAPKVPAPLRPKRRGTRRRIESSVRGRYPGWEGHQNKLPERQRLRSKLKKR